jgi:flagellar hook assembly protein FlgD
VPLAKTEQPLVTIVIFDIQGKLIDKLINKRIRPGRHMVAWNGIDRNGTSVSSGVYFYQIKAGDFNSIKRMVLIK